MRDLQEGVLELFAEHGDKAREYYYLHGVHFVADPNQNRNYHVEYMARRKKALEYQSRYGKEKRREKRREKQAEILATIWGDLIFGEIANDNLWPFAYRYWR